MDSSLLADPWIAAQIDAALEPYVGRVPARDLSWMREQLAELLARDEHAVRMLRRAHPREADTSGERVAPGQHLGAPQASLLRPQTPDGAASDPALPHKSPRGRTKAG